MPGHTPHKLSTLRQLVTATVDALERVEAGTIAAEDQLTGGRTNTSAFSRERHYYNVSVRCGDHTSTSTTHNAAQSTHMQHSRGVRKAVKGSEAGGYQFLASDSFSVRKSCLFPFVVCMQPQSPTIRRGHERIRRRNHATCAWLTRNHVTCLERRLQVHTLALLRLLRTLTIREISESVLLLCGAF